MTSIAERLVSARRALSQRQFKQAHEICVAVLQQEPGNVEAHYLLACNAIERREISKAKTLLEVAHELAPAHVDVVLQLARCLLMLHEDVAARELLTITSLVPSTAAQHDTLGVLLTRLGVHDAATPHFKQSVALMPTPGALFNLASNERIVGVLGDSLEHFMALIQQAPDYYQAYSVIPELRRATPDNNLIDTITRLLPQLEPGSDGYYHLCMALAREHDALGQQGDMWRWLKAGNSAKKQRIAYQFSQDAANFQAVKEHCGATFFKRAVAGSKAAGPRPIFILGMPRSGTTLLERILSGPESVHAPGELHDVPITVKRLSGSNSPQVLDPRTMASLASLDIAALANEYRQRVRQHAPQGSCFIDKMPLNFFYAGVIQKALPEAKIICMQRNPMDVCFSNLKQLFAVNFSYYNYSLDQEDAARFIVAFHDLVAHWREWLPSSQFMEVSYEALVDSPEEHAKRVFEFCELSWRSEYLAIENNAAPVATASAVQVRQPLYRSGMARWKAYEQQLQPAARIFNAAGLKF